MLRKMQHPDLHFTYPTVKQSRFATTYTPISEDFIKEWQELLHQGPYFTPTQWIDTIKEGAKQALITVGESNSLNRKLSLLSSQGGYKVSIIWLPEMMNTECANKMLKLLEEPPSQTIFLLVSEEPEHLLETIRSRTQQIHLKRLSDDEIAIQLTEKRLISAETAQRIAHIAAGSWTKALHIIEGMEDDNAHLEAFKQLMRLSFGRKVKDLRQWTEQQSRETRDTINARLKEFTRLIRESFVYNFQIEELRYITSEEENFLRNFAPYINEKNITPLARLFEQCRKEIKQNVRPQIVLFDMAMNVIKLLRS